MNQTPLPYVDEHGFFRRTNILARVKDAKIYPTLPTELRDFIFRFQTACVVECCGLDAFEFTSSNQADERWAPNLLVEILLEEEITKMDKFPGDILTVHELNQLIYKQDAIFLFLFLKENLRKRREAK